MMMSDQFTSVYSWELREYLVVLVIETEFRIVVFHKIILFKNILPL